jgi:hypothetical protein
MNDSLTHIRRGFAMRIAIILSFVLVCTTACAQEIVWEKMFSTAGVNEHHAVDVISVADGGFIAAARFGRSRDPLTSIFLVRTTSNGTSLWERELAGHDSSIAAALVPGGDSAFYIIGSTRDGALNGDTAWHVWCAKLDMRGEILWERKHGPGIIQGADATRDGGFILTGRNGSEMLLVELTADGDLLWERAVGLGARAAGYSVRQTSDGGFVAVGTTVDSLNADVLNVDGDALVVRTDSAGQVLFSRACTITFGLWEDGRCIEEVADGYAVAAYVRASTQESEHLGQVYMIGVDREGNVTWGDHVPLYVVGDELRGTNEPRMSRKLSDGKIVVVGGSGPSPAMPVIFQVDDKGKLEWKKYLSPQMFVNNVATAFRPLPDGGFIVAMTSHVHMVLARLAHPTSGVETEWSVPEKMDLSWRD